MTRPLLAWLGLFGAAVAVRSLRLGLVFVDGEVRFPYGADELYHLRRIWFTVVNFPETLVFDAYLNHPVGAPPIWPPAFDWGLAAVAWAVGATDQHAVEVVAAWAPPVIGGLGVLAAAWLARRTFSPGAGWATGWLLVVLPAHVGHSVLGLVDHHVAVGLLVTLLLAAAMRLAGPRAPGRLGAAVATGTMIAAAILIWPGALLHVIVVQSFLVAQLLVAAEPASAVARARDLALSHGLAALLLLPFCAGNEWPDFGPLSPWVLSNFQPLWFGSGALALAVVAWLWSKTSLGASRVRRAGSACALAALGVGAAWLLVPGLRDAVRNATGFFGRDPFLDRVAELTPLLYPNGSFDPALAHGQFSYLVWAYPLALLWLGARAVSSRRSDVLLLLFASAAFSVATLHQHRFADVAAAGFALVMAPALVEGFRSGRRGYAAPRAVWLAAALPIGAAALLPYGPWYAGDVIASGAALRGEKLRLDPGVRVARVMRRIADWLGQETPPTRGYLDRGQKPEYGVLAPWGHGHRLRYYAERPMVQDNFGPWGGRAGFEAARRYYESRDERRAHEIAARLGVRYVVATPAGSGQRLPQQGSLAQRLALVPEAGGAFSFRAAPLALARHRLVFVADDADLVRRRGEPRWTAAVYEVVPGAEVVGRGPPERAVHFELEVPLPGRAPIRYRATAWADAAGRYELRLPHPSETGYQVRSGARSRTLRVSEADVREGRRVAGPRFE